MTAELPSIWPFKPTLRRSAPAMLLALATAALSACAKVEIAAPHQAPISKEARMLLGRKNMDERAPIFIRIFKAESELEIWKQRSDGHFHHYKTYPICHWSGALGPKLRQGDKQAPEGFYTVNRHQMNPNSRFHLSFDLGYPNAYDKAHGRTGNYLMVHGKCRSAGCYAMTDALMEEIYAFAREAFAGGQQAFHVHAFPFRMTPENLARYRGDRNTQFWRSLKKGYDHFEYTRQVPNVEICAKRYNVNVEWNGRPLNPRGACPRFRPGPVVAYNAPVSTTAPAVIKAAQSVSAPRPVPAVSPAANTRYYSGAPRMNLAPGQRRRTPDPIADLLRK